MTKEELKQEAEEKYHNHKIVDFQGFYNHHYYYLGYVESAEPREKRIAELEQENKVLAQNLEDTEILNKTYEKRFSKLEKENAELKGEADSVLDNWCKGDDPCPHLKKRDEQLTKAKELIQNIIRVTWGEGWNYSLDWKVKAEQFLSEVEK